MRVLSLILHLWWAILGFFVIVSFGLTLDGVLLLSLKYSILSDPQFVLENWNFNDATPCSWTGVRCTAVGAVGRDLRVTGLSLPNSQLLGSILADLGTIEFRQVGVREIFGLRNVAMVKSSKDTSYAVHSVVLHEARVIVGAEEEELLVEEAVEMEVKGMVGNLELEVVLVVESED